MDDLDDFHQRVQSYLIKKDPEVGRLKFLSSRTTEENQRHIDELCTSFLKIFTSCRIPIAEEASSTTPRCVEALKYLVLNTNFKSQEYITEDLLHGHLVDMCPPLSPYLLIEILCHLNYEKILAEFILLVPLDLCNEILEIFRRFLHLLDFKRGFPIILMLVKYSYLKVILCHDIGTQSMDFEVNVEGLILNYQEILTFFGDKKYTRLNEVTEIHRSERCGYILRDIIILTRNCLEFSKNSSETELKMEELEKFEKFHPVTFGREALKKIPTDEFTRHMRSLDLELVAMLLKKVKEINCNIYLDWASLEADGNPSVSLQQSIGVECFKLIEFLKNSEGQEHLLECLQHLAVDPKSLNPCATMSIQKLVEELENDNKDCLKELLKQHQHWDTSVLESLRKKVDLFDKQDFFDILEYLVTLMGKEGQEDHKQNVYNLVTKILMKQNLKDVYDVTLSFILKNDAENVLESSYTESMFENFILNNSDFKSAPKLRTILFFLMKNPAKFLTILLKISLGCEKYKNILVNPEDLTLLSPILNIREESGKLGVNCLLRIGFEDELNAKKFGNFVKTMLKHRILSPEELIYCLYIPWLEDDKTPLDNIRMILSSLRQVVTMIDNLNAELLLEALAKCMTRLRNDKITAKYVTSELLTLAARVVHTVLADRDDWFKDAERRRWIIRVEARLQPIDKFNFQKLFSQSEYFDVCEIFEDYFRNINSAIVRATSADENLTVQGLNRDELTAEIIKHLMLAATELEFVRMALEITTIHYDYFDCRNEVEGFHKVLELTLGAATYALHGTRDHFPFLIKALARFVKGIIVIDFVISKIPFLHAFLENFRKYRGILKGSEFERFYEEALVRMNNRPAGESTTEALAEGVACVSAFADKCLEVVEDRQGEDKRLGGKGEIYQEVITMSLNVEDGRQSCMMRRVRDLLLANTDD